jgi:hypothetical protein
MKENNPEFPTVKSSVSPGEREKIKRVISARGLCGLANDTKWDEFLSGMRAQAEWRPGYRWKCVDGAPSGWDVEWFHHLPFPMISVEWFDLYYLEEKKERRLPPRLHVTDHSPWIEKLLHRVGLEYQKGKTTVRIFGYSPKSQESFDDP